MPKTGTRPARQETAGPYKIYVMLGFHTSFHHSWRGDTPDEAGFGTDIRCVRAILRLLNDANEQGLPARGYWDIDVYWTLQNIIPRYAPDIIAGIRQRVQAGSDEIVLGYFNNGANHAATERELRAAVAYAKENPFGSGLKQVFGQITTLLRPQESMVTAGQNAVLLEEGVTGLVLYYAAIPFNALSTFIPTLPPEQRYNPLWLRCRPDEPPIELWPCISPGDLVENVSLEALMLKLRRMQISGQVQSDLLLHINFDADSDTWLPMKIPQAFAWFPNTGGLQEYIRVVERYPWAEFTVPSEYRQDHSPEAEVLVRQDLADGGFDGNYSWAEKHTSLQNWAVLEQSRLHTRRADALARRISEIPEALAEEIHHRLWEGEDSAFFQRLIGLTTTHFGMSTPVINEERQAKAERLLGQARHQAASAERTAALALRRQAQEEEEALYVFEVYRPVGEEEQPDTVRVVVRLPVVLPRGVSCLQVASSHRKEVSLVDVQPLLDGSAGGELLFSDTFGPGQARVYPVTPAPPPASAPPPSQRLHNAWLDLHLSEDTGIASLTFQGRQIGGDGFLEPFITYRSHKRPQSWFASSYTFDRLHDEVWAGLSRARMRTRISMETPYGLVDSEFQYTFSLFDHLPYLLVDVAVDYASTPPADIIQNVQQQLRRLLDLRWIEVAPFQLNLGISAPADRPLRVWKHNYLGVTSCYDLDYGRHNPHNRNLDSFNHQVTAGWVAVSDGRLGLLLAENAEVLASMAFCPMRLRERDSRQHLSLNPFGSYYGRQLDYRHLGGSGVGAELTTAISGSLRPNGPSFNGQHQRFSLLLAPYHGDGPPAQLQADARAFFYPPGVVYHRTPAGLDAVVPEDLRQRIAAARRERQRGSDAPLPVPRALLANPADGAVDLVWEAPRDTRVSGYEVRWRATGEVAWQGQQIPPRNRWQVAGLENGRRCTFQLRALAGERHSDWTAEVEATPGPVTGISLLSIVPPAALGTLLRLVVHSLAHVIRARLWWSQRKHPWK